VLLFIYGDFYQILINARDNMDYKLIEDNLKKINAVVSTKIVFNEDDVIDEVHIVSNGHRGPKQISRDIQSVLLATYDVDVDHKKISIAQIPDDLMEANGCRMKLEGVLRETSGSTATVKVTFSNKGEAFSSTRTGINSTRNVDRMLVECTLEAASDACGICDVFLFDDIKQVSLSGSTVVLVVVTGVERDIEKKLSGSSIVNNDFYGAVVKATLDAVNRFISK
jgi:hypothetical protein